MRFVRLADVSFWDWGKSCGAVSYGFSSFAFDSLLLGWGKTKNAGRMPALTESGSRLDAALFDSHHITLW